MSSFSYPSKVNTSLTAVSPANTLKANVTGSVAQPTDVSILSTASASAVAVRDSNANLYANNVINNIQTIVSTGGTTALTVGSAMYVTITGSLSHTITMPVTSTLPQTGVPYYITNLSTGSVTLQSSGLNTLTTLMPNASAYSFCASTSSTGTSAWNTTLMPMPSITPVNNTVAVRDSAGKGYFNNLRTTTLMTTTSATTLVLTAASGQIQQCNGSTNAFIWQLPATSTLSRGWSFTFINVASVPVTVNSATSVLIVVLPPNGCVTVTCASTTLDTLNGGWLASNTNGNVIGSRTRYYGSSSSLSGSLGTIVWDTADFTDPLLVYSSGSFTCKAPGRVNVMASVMVTGTAALNNNVAIEIQKNTAVQNRRTLYLGAGITGLTANIDGTVAVVAGDVIRIQVQSSLTSPVINASNTENYVSVVYV